MNETADNDREPEASRPVAQREQPAGLFERLRALFGLAPASVRDDIEDAIDESAGAEFTPQERAILKNVLALHDVRVADVMVPRADIVALALDTPLRDVLDLFRTAGHSRLPVYEDTLDDPRGMIHIRDFVVFLASDPRFGLMSEPRRRGAEIAPATSGLDMPLSEARILQAGALCAPVDAGPRPSAPHAGVAHPYGAGHRRIRRHRRLGVDRGRGRIDRRRHRGRTRRGRDAEFIPPGTASSSSRPARRSTTSPRRSVSISPRSPTPRRSTRSAAW